MFCSMVYFQSCRCFTIRAFPKVCNSFSLRVHVHSGISSRSWNHFLGNCVFFRASKRRLNQSLFTQQAYFVSTEAMVKLQSKFDSHYYHDALERLKSNDQFHELIRSKTRSSNKGQLFSLLKDLSVLKQESLIKEYVRTIQNILLSKAESLESQDIKELSHCLDRVLFFYWKDGSYRDSETLFRFMKDCSIATESSYNLMIRITCKQLPQFADAVADLIVEMKRAAFPLSARTYFPLLLKYVAVGQVEEAARTFSLIKKLEANFHDENHGQLISAIGHSMGNFLDSKFFNDMIDYHQVTGFLYGPFSKSAMLNAFKKLQYQNWKLRECEVDLRGICSSCSCSLNTISISKRDKKVMSEGLAWFLKNRLAEDIPSSDLNDTASLTRYYRDLGEIIKDPKKLNSKVKDLRLKTLRRLKPFLERTGPYDILVDMLNLGYTGEKGFNAAKVEVVVRELLEQGRKVMGLCAGPLREYHLKNNLTLSPDEVRIHKMIQRLKKWGCGLFFVGNSKYDDLYMIFTILHHNFDIQLLTNDKFQDHLDGIDKFAVAAFKKWMKVNTMHLIRFDNGRPIFEVGTAVDRVTQIHGDAYHFPLKDGRWLCCVKECSQQDIKAIKALQDMA